MKGDVSQLAALWKNKLGAVTLVWTLHHVADPEETLRGIHRVLKPGGKVLVGDWVVGDGQEKGICFKFTSRQIQQFLIRAGFEGIDVEWIEPELVLIIGEKNGSSAS